MRGEHRSASPARKLSDVLKLPGVSPVWKRDYQKSQADYSERRAGDLLSASRIGHVRPERARFRKLFQECERLDRTALRWSSMVAQSARPYRFSSRSTKGHWRHTLSRYRTQ